jgi:hypothetical protein
MTKRDLHSAAAAEKHGNTSLKSARSAGVAADTYGPNWSYSEILLLPLANIRT